MGKLLGFLLSVLVVYAVYYDLSVGTLPHANSQKTAVASATVEPEVNFPYFKEKVQPGETLISIVEHQANQSISVPISNLVHDFKSLNPGQSPEKLQIGRTYRFPRYSK